MDQFTTPMMKQYFDIKKDYPDCLLFYRMGDFYELFLEDAYIGAKVLDITLTGKSNGKNERIPMAGVPYHAVDSYLHKLVKAGYKVAICEQMSPPSKYVLVELDFVLILTPGTILDDKALEKNSNNFIVSLYIDKKIIGISAADVSTGYFQTTEIVADNCEQTIKDELARLHPSECILPPEIYNNPEILTILKNERGMNIYCFHEWSTFSNQAESYIKRHFNMMNLGAFNLVNKHIAQATTAALLGYLHQTQKTAASHIKKIFYISSEKYMQLDKATVINLELFSTIREHDLKGSLLSIFDHTTTSMGGRLLKDWLRKPLLDKDKIQYRQDCVEILIDEKQKRERIIELLKEVVDIERLLSRLTLGLGNPYDLNRLKDSLKIIIDVKQELSQFTSPLFLSLQSTISDNLQSVIAEISRIIKENPGIDIKGGNIINEGIAEDLDKLRKRVVHSRTWITELEKQERERTGISSLKVRYNKVFGFYIEISKANLSSTPADYIRKQTLVNGERFITPDLKKHEEIILNTEDEINKKEYLLFQKIIDYTLSYTKELQDAAYAIAVLDCLTNFAYIAEKNSYIKPQLIDTGEIHIKQGRHPVVEKLLDEENQFVPNDITLNHDNQQILLITGPNMAGKSVLIRQVALIILMNQIGSFVPAEKATLSLVDRIFVRSGASDVITSGLSTFMVEMVETAYILHHATKNSLIIMDEIGRGTSTYDGMSIAWAVAEYLAINNTITPKTLFATHYHELQALEQEYQGRIVNFQMDVIEENNQPIFLHSLQPGGASSSYGIAVAKMAGIPDLVIKRAKEKLAEMENKNTQYANAMYTPSVEQTISIIEHVITDEILNVDLHQMTPLDALNYLAGLKEKLRIIPTSKISSLDID